MAQVNDLKLSFIDLSNRVQPIYDKLDDFVNNEAKFADNISKDEYFLLSSHLDKDINEKFYNKAIREELNNRLESRMEDGVLKAIAFEILKEFFTSGFSNVDKILENVTVKLIKEDKITFDNSTHENYISSRDPNVIEARSINRLSYARRLTYAITHNQQHMLRKYKADAFESTYKIMSALVQQAYNNMLNYVGDIINLDMYRKNMSSVDIDLSMLVDRKYQASKSSLSKLPFITPPNPYEAVKVTYKSGNYDEQIYSTKVSTSKILSKSARTSCKEDINKYNLSTIKTLSHNQFNVYNPFFDYIMKDIDVSRGDFEAAAEAIEPYVELSEHHSDRLMRTYHYIKQYNIFSDYTKQGKSVFFEYVQDSRGRMYSLSYPFNPQGDSFGKSFLVLRDRYYKPETGKSNLGRKNLFGTNLSYITPKDALLIQMASHIGNFDKLSYQDRISKMNNFMKHVKELEEFSPEALEELLDRCGQTTDSLPELYNLVYFFLSDKDVMHPETPTVSFDAVSSGIQIFAVTTQDPLFLSCYGLDPEGTVKVDTFQDPYVNMFDKFNEKLEAMDLDPLEVTRKEGKEVCMTSLYGSVQRPKEILGEHRHAEYVECMEAYATIANNQLRMLTTMFRNSFCVNCNTIDKAPTRFNWVMPNGNHCTVANKATVKLSDTVEKEFTDIVNPYDISMSANITHSLDAFVLSEVIGIASYHKGTLAKATRILNGEPEEVEVCTDTTVVDTCIVWDYPSVALVEHIAKYGIPKELVDTELLGRVKELVTYMNEIEPFAINPIHDCFAVKPWNINALRAIYNYVMANLSRRNYLMVAMLSAYGLLDKNDPEGNETIYRMFQSYLGKGANVRIDSNVYRNILDHEYLLS